MISRHWKGIAKRGEADNYVNHLKADTFPKLSSIDGFISASILKREVDQGTQFLVITRWESLEAIERFAGPAAEAAVVPESVQAMMITYDRTAAHYQVVEDCLVTGDGEETKDPTAVRRRIPSSTARCLHR